MKAWYCGGSSSIWSSIYNFTTSPDCDNVINVTALQTILQRQHSVGILYLRIHS